METPFFKHGFGFESAVSTSREPDVLYRMSTKIASSALFRLLQSSRIVDTIALIDSGTRTVLCISVKDSISVE